MLIKLVEKWLEENDIQHINGALHGIIAVSARCWRCASRLGRFVEIWEDVHGNVTVYHQWVIPVVIIHPADPQLFPKLLEALHRCEHMIKGEQR